MTLARLSDVSARQRTRHLLARLPVALALAALGVLALGIRPSLLGVLAIAMVTEELARIDIAEHRLPNRFVLPLYPVALLGVVGEWMFSGTSPLAAIGAGAGTFAFLLVLCLAGGMGMGDVKLGGALGICLGTLGVVAAAGGLVLAFVTGAIGGTVALLRAGTARSSSRGRQRIPFGPFLLAGFWLSVVCFALGMVGST